MHVYGARLGSREHHPLSNVFSSLISFFFLSILYLFIFIFLLLRLSVATHYTIQCAPGAMPFAAENVPPPKIHPWNSRNILSPSFLHLPANKIWMKNQKQKGRRKRNNQRKREYHKNQTWHNSSAGIYPVTPFGSKKKKKTKAPTATLVTRPGRLMATYSVARRRRIGGKDAKVKK